MALSGLEIYKLLPQTNCKDCNYPTCLAFAMKLAAKQATLDDCPHVSEEAKTKLESASAPPIRLIELKGEAGEVKVGNETVLFRHEKTFYNKCGLFLHLRDSGSVDDLKQAASEVAAFSVAVTAIREVTQKPLILIAPTADLARAGIAAAANSRPLLHAANADNWEEMAEVAKEASLPLAVKGDTLDELADLTQKLTEAGVADLVLDPGVSGYLDSLDRLTAIRRLAVKETFRPLGYPVITFPGADPAVDQSLLAAEQIAKYGGFIVLDEFNPASAYALLVLRQNIYTDPQKPIQVQPGIYELNSPDANSPLMVTTNFSITYFSIANEVEGTGKPGWLLVADAEGMSVLTAWAAGKFDAERIAKDVKTFNVEEKVPHKKMIIPGHVAVISGELEEELPGWEIMVGPREAVDIGAYLETMWQN
jgi:acetyl-CoA decarbonylase/synthase complex subunit gamma